MRSRSKSTRMPLGRGGEVRLSHQPVMPERLPREVETCVVSFGVRESHIALLHSSCGQALHIEGRLRQPITRCQPVLLLTNRCLFGILFEEYNGRLLFLSPSTTISGISLF